MDKLRAETTSSSSRCVTASAQAVHSFEVTSFSLLEGMGAGRFVSSRTFRAGGRGWNIRVYPDGGGLKEEDKAEYVSAFLYLADGPKDAKTRTKYTLELLLQKDGKLTRSSSVMLSYTFEAADTNWGLPKFVEKSKLKPLLRLKNNDDDDDCFTVRCALTVIGESQSEDVAAPAIIVEEIPEPNMQQHFERMLKTRKGTDVTFDVDGRLFQAHRCVLAARSPVFEAELFGPMKEKATAEPIRVVDMEPSVFEELLHFIYTDSVSSDGKNGDDDKNVSMQHLLVAADRYGLDRLRLMCEVNLCQGIDAQTVATTLALAEQHHCPRLKGACLKFVASRDVLGVVMKTEGFEHLVASCPLIAVEILDKIVAEA